CGHGWQLLTDGTWAGPSLSARAARSVPRRPGARPAAVRRASGGEGAPGQPLVGLDVARTGALDDVVRERRRRDVAVPVPPRCRRRQPVAHELLVEAGLRAPGLP